MGKRPRLKPTRLLKKLLQVRQRLGLSQNELIRRMGFTDVLVQASISGYELGTREPPLPVLLAYAEVAGVWVDVLINDDLDLPDRLPCSPKHEGIKRASAARRNKR
jgi:transcriptional regulator with XRE-family HTH domain